MQSEKSNTLVKLAKAVIEHAPEGSDAFWDIEFSDIEAALSAAEPVRWLIEEHLPTGSIRWQTVEHEHHAREIAGKSKRTTVAPLYRDPPAPSVAVKALLDDVWNAAVERAAAIANDSVHLTPDPGAAIKTMLNGRATLHPSSEAALSAQVQDVAGLESNPVTLRWWCQQLLDIIENYDISHDSCDEEIALINDIRSSVDPAAPAKQEGKP